MTDYKKTNTSRLSANHYAESRKSGCFIKSNKMFPRIGVYIIYKAINILMTN